MNNEQTTFITMNTNLPRYLPYPEFLLRMELSQTAKVIYALLLHRTTLSMKNGWTDDDGNVFVVFTVRDIAKETCLSVPTVKRALNELRAADMITCERKNRFLANRIFVKLPEVSEMNPPRYQKRSLRGIKNEPLTNRYNKYKSNKVVTGQKMISFPIPDYDCEEGASL